MLIFNKTLTRIIYFYKNYIILNNWNQNIFDNNHLRILISIVSLPSSAAIYTPWIIICNTCTNNFWIKCLLYQDVVAGETRPLGSQNCKSHTRIIFGGCRKDECIAKCEAAQPQKLDHVNCFGHLCDCYYVC